MNEFGILLCGLMKYAKILRTNSLTMNRTDHAMRSHNFNYFYVSCASIQQMVGWLKGNRTIGANIHNESYNGQCDNGSTIKATR